MSPFSWLAQSPDSPLAQVVRRIQMVATSQLPVLVLGETGVGKELAARAIHAASPRSEKPFVAVNCGALSATLLESTLFGAVRGAYTGAHQECKGLVRAAHGGTLFLDEIGELPLEAQSRLLRVLQEHKVTPVGSHQEVPVDFRLVCATHRDLQEAVAAKRFREDLFFRIHVFPIRLAPLRERPADIMPLASHIWHDLYPMRAELAQITRYEDRAALIRFPWPGNVRQLKNLLERFGILLAHGCTLSEILQEESNSLAVHSPTETYHANVRPDWPQIHGALKTHRQNKSRAAKALGISRGSLCYQIKKREAVESRSSESDER